MTHTSQGLIISFFVLVLLSIAFSYFTFVVRKDFVTFTNEDNIPAQLDIAAISEL